MESLKPFFNYAAKAVAAFVVPLLVMALAWLGDLVGADLSVDTGELSTWVTTLVVSSLTALAVYFKPNKTDG